MITRTENRNKFLCMYCGQEKDCHMMQIEHIYGTAGPFLFGVFDIPFGYTLIYSECNTRKTNQIGQYFKVGDPTKALSGKIWPGVFSDFTVNMVDIPETNQKTYFYHQYLFSFSLKYLVENYPQDFQNLSSRIFGIRIQLAISRIVKRRLVPNEGKIRLGPLSENELYFMRTFQTVIQQTHSKHHKITIPPILAVVFEQVTGIIDLMDQIKHLKTRQKIESRKLRLAPLLVDFLNKLRSAFPGKPLTKEFCKSKLIEKIEWFKDTYDLRDKYLELIPSLFDYIFDSWSLTLNNTASPFKGGYNKSKNEKLKTKCKKQNGGVGEEKSINF